MEEAKARFQQVEALFNRALTVSLVERDALIDTQCGGDGELAEEVRSLLSASEAEERSASDAMRRASGETVAPPRIVGHYQLDRLIGRGGMGAVYLAHRADGQFDQKVAIKLIDLPLATDLFRERFRQERQLLAGLQHPYIARLLDGGVTGGGDLYLVMEYVDGEPIHRYCDRKSLAEPERIALFLRVCEAVQFAHQHFIVHRDVKSDNILVGADGTPRLLDFGTAKLLSPSVDAAGSQMTREGYLSFTPQCASPEQILGNPITTASDTYSLGVLLYILLTGAAPYELKDLSTAEMIRVVCEEPPRKPAHGVSPAEKLDKDIEAIIDKALRKDPRERYTTVEQLTSDLRAYREGRPVDARQGTFRYKAVKFVQRHRAGLAATAVVAASLVAAGAGIVWQARVANRERQRAEARSADLRQLSNSLLSELDEAIKQLPGSTGAQKLLVTRVLEHLDRMASDARGDRQTQLDLVDAYTRLANLQGNPYEQNLGDPSGAMAGVAKAIGLATPLVVQNANDKDALLSLATAQESQGEIFFGTARTQEAIESMRAATATYDRLIAGRDASPQLICDVASAYGSLGDELGQPGTASMADVGAAVASFRKSMELDNRALGIDAGYQRARRGLAINQMKIGSTELETDPAQALKDFELALERADALPKDQQSTLAMRRMRTMILRKEGNAMIELGQFEQAAPLLSQVEQTQRKLSAADPDDLRALADLDVILDDEAAASEAEADPLLASPGSDRHKAAAEAAGLLKHFLAVIERMLRQDASNENWKLLRAGAQVRLATAEATLGHPQAALASAGLATLRQLAAKDQASPMALDEAASGFLHVRPAALRDATAALAFERRAADQSRRHSPSILLKLAQAQRATGKRAEARATAEEALALLAAPQPGSPKANTRKLLEAEAQAGP